MIIFNRNRYFQLLDKEHLLGYKKKIIYFIVYKNQQLKLNWHMLIKSIQFAHEITYL